MKPADIGLGKDAAMHPAADTRRAYLKPAFRHEAVFETMALACGKVDTTQLSCRSLRKLS